MSLVDRIKPHVARIETQAARGDVLAQRIIDLYEMWRKCSADPGAQGLTEAAFNEWTRREGLDRKPSSSYATPTDDAPR